MIIGIEASRANREQKTGTEWYAYHLIRAIAKCDRATDFRLYTDRHLEPMLQNLGPNFEMRVLRWPPRRFWTQLRFSFEMLSHRPDVLFVPAHVVPLLHPRATVTTIHDIGFDRYPEVYAKKELIYNRFAVRFALRSATHIIVPTHFVKDEICDHYRCNPTRMTVIHHGFYPEPFQNILDDPTILQRFSLTKPFFLFVGRLQKKKNIIRIVDAFVRLQERHATECELVLIGQPDHGFAEALEIIARHRVEQKVRILGYIGQQDMARILKHAAVFLFPSLYEGFGIPILEAQAAGTPVLTSTSGPMPEVAGKGAFFVNPLDTDGLSHGMERLLTDDQLRNALRLRGYENIRRFSWERCADQTLFVLRNAL